MMKSAFVINWSARFPPQFLWPSIVRIISGLIYEPLSALIYCLCCKLHCYETEICLLGQWNPTYPGPQPDLVSLEPRLGRAGRAGAEASSSSSGQAVLLLFLSQASPHSRIREHLMNKINALPNIPRNQHANRNYRRCNLRQRIISIIIGSRLNSTGPAMPHNRRRYKLRRRVMRAEIDRYFAPWDYAAVLYSRSFGSIIMALMITI